MKILHYALGFPPYRTGGLTKYCIDLMAGQKEQGQEVALLWPGKISFIKSKLSIRKDKNIEGLNSYEIINPLPVALDEGITDISAYTANCDKEVYKIFLKKLKPDAIHLHTLMGLHKEFLEVTKELKIKTVFTTHDYYGLCPKVTLFRRGCCCDDDNECRECVECNQTSLSIKKIMLMQSPLYRMIKDSLVIKMLRKRHRKEFFDCTTFNYSMEEETKVSIAEAEKKSKGFRELRKYYIGMYELIDTIHFNSTVAEMVYKRYFQPNDSRVINITHRGIADHRKKKEFTGKLKITYLAPTKPFKGFDILKVALDELWQEGHRDFELNIFSITNKISQYMNIQDGYKYEELEDIFTRTDLLVAPSVWYETFGFTVLEALSYGVPVLVSMNVGAKDLIQTKDYGILTLNLKDELLEVLNDRIRLVQLNKEICRTLKVPTMEQHILEIEGLYYYE